MRITKKFTKTHNGFVGCFYRPDGEGDTGSNISLCSDFINVGLGVISNHISITLSDIRPHQKGWNKIEIDHNHVEIGTVGVYVHYRVRDFLFLHNIGPVFWIRVTELPQV